MKISYKDKKLEALCRDKNKLIKAYGQLRATKIMQRIDDMNSAECLEDTRNLPGHYIESFHPGVTLEEKLEEMGMSVKEFAIRTDKPEKTINAVLKGDSSVTPDMAVAFEIVTGIPASFWMNKQQNYNEYVARKKREEALKASIEWSKQFPLAVMQKLGWIPTLKSEEEKVSALLSFFAVSSREAWQDYYYNQPLKVAFRISLSQTKNPFAVSAWLRRGEIQAMGQNVDCEYSPDLLRNTISDFKRLLFDNSNQMPARLQAVCASCGIKLIYTECLPQAPISGATRWIQNVPCIQLSGRYKMQDVFWFNFFHEIGHILLHGKKDIFLEDIEYSDYQKEKEMAADAFASEVLLSAKQEQEITMLRHWSREDIIMFADKFDTVPAIILGRLKHRSLIPQSYYRDLVPNVELWKN